MYHKALGVLTNLALLALVAVGAWNFCGPREVWITSAVYAAGFIPVVYLLRRFWIAFDQVPLSHPTEWEMRSFLMTTLAILWPLVVIGWLVLVVQVVRKRKWKKLRILITLSFEEVEIDKESKE